jgi:hypothetical protein
MRPQFGMSWMINRPVTPVVEPVMLMARTGDWTRYRGRTRDAPAGTVMRFVVDGPEVVEYVSRYSEPDACVLMIKTSAKAWEAAHVAAVFAHWRLAEVIGVHPVELETSTVPMSVPTWSGRVLFAPASDDHSRRQRTSAQRITAPSRR